MKSITPEFLDQLIDFTPQSEKASSSVGEVQREGTVAAFNMLVRNRCAYLADEVGMGKTYIALGVLCLLRYFNPHARALVIAPRQNIQQKWTKELKNFVRNNWKIVGNRVKSLESTPVWEPIECQNLNGFAHDALTNQDRDFFLRMTSFSLAAKNEESRVRYRKLLVRAIPWLKETHIDISSRERFLDSYAIALNGAFPKFDLVIVDEAHNLKQGFGTQVSNRNRVMGLALGHKSGFGRQDWFKPVVSRTMFLSATPFENDYADLQRQLDIFGFGNAQLSGPNENDEPLGVSILSNAEASVERKRMVARRLLIRRTSSLEINAKRYTKNMYRREWRKGGLKTFDEPIRINDTRTRLVIALLQKKVSEILQSEKFNNSFQIGMLSSFESFSQDMNTAMRNLPVTSESADEESVSNGAKFDDSNQQRNLSSDEREGIDSSAISDISRSFFERFETELPHPKLDRVVESLDDVFDTGEKALIFVRRVATVGELAQRLNNRFNHWIKHRMQTFLPHLSDEIDGLFQRFHGDYRSTRLGLSESASEFANDLKELSEVLDLERRDDFESQNDRGGVSSFFEWYFRGDGPKGVLSGAAFQRNRLNSTASVHSLLFEDNYVASLLDSDPLLVFERLADVLGLSPARCEQDLRVISYACFCERSSQQKGYPRLYVYESYQVAALTLLARLSDDREIQNQALIVLSERYPDLSFSNQVQVPPGYPSGADSLRSTTIFTELRNRPALRARLWPYEKAQEFRERFRIQEQRRELFSAVARLGAAYIDLYLVAMKSHDSFDLNHSDDSQESSARLTHEFLDLLQRQQDSLGFHAYYELSQVADCFHTLVSVNFPDIEQQALPSLARYFGNILGKQEPVGGSSGQVNKTLVGQFRMPGFPLVMISTDVLQEGEDLHTFCKRVLHYGLAWNPSSLEQRTGRVDRIGGLAQRRLGGLTRDPREDELIQVFFPHLRDTVELLQVRRVLRRLNTFMRLIHSDVDIAREDSSLNANIAVHEEDEDLPQYKNALKSAFEVEREWLQGELVDEPVSSPDWKQQFGKFACSVSDLKKRLDFDVKREGKHYCDGTITFSESTPFRSFRSTRAILGSSQEFHIRLRSHVAGEETLIECESPVVELDLDEPSNTTLLIEAASAAPGARICMQPKFTRWTDRIFVRQQIVFDATLTSVDELVRLFESVVPVAAIIHQRIKKLAEGH